MKEPFANLELNFLVHCFQHINIDKGFFTDLQREYVEMFSLQKNPVF